MTTKSVQQWESTAKKCSGKNHVSIKEKGIHVVEQNDSDSDNELFVGCIGMEINSIDKEWTNTIKINDTQIDFQLDTGGTCNLLSYETTTKQEQN